MSKETPSIEKLQQLISQGPFNKWLNFTVLKAGEDEVEVKAAWRDEWVVNLERRYTHGGILAAIVDVAADFAIADHGSILSELHYYCLELVGPVSSTYTIWAARCGARFSVPQRHSCRCTASS